MPTKIEWTDATWNPVTGCTKVSPGCARCYAEAIEKRFKRNPSFLPGEAVIRCHPERLEHPLKWRKPQRVFVNSMSDLFHEDVSDEFIDQIFAVMALAAQHTFQILTKRPDRMLEYMKNISYWRIHDAFMEVGRTTNQMTLKDVWPLPNVHLYVSVENQYWAERRIPLLLQTPAAVRGVSYEPALKGVDFEQITSLEGMSEVLNALTGEWWPAIGNPYEEEAGVYRGERLDHIIMGGESGPKARPMDIDWVRDTIRQCKAADVPVFVKQMGSVWARKLGIIGSKGGDMDFWPEDLRIRENANAKR